MNKQTGRRDLRAKYIAVAVSAAFAPWSVHAQTPPPANQLPSLTLTQGSGTVNAPAGNFLQIDQFSQRAIFSGSMTMGSAGHMNVSQPGSSAIGLFRDTSGSLTQIFGRITANGQIFISNQNGVLMGNTARIEVGGLFATNLSITDGDFMDGRYRWFNDGATGGVTNQGQIEIITPSSYAVLAGPQVRNDGVIVARTGTVVLAAGDRVSLDMIGDGLISVSVDQAALNASVLNTGNITAEGGTVVLTARSANALLDTVVNAGGAIRATSLIERNGEIVLDGGSAGTVLIAGNHNAGSSTVSGANVTVNGTIVTDLGSGTQTVTTPGTLTIDGVGASATNSGFIHQGSGEQRVEAGNLLMTGGTGIGTNAVITSSDANADQKITVTGNLQVKGGPSGDGNQAIIRSAGNQIIDGNAAIMVEGGASSGLAGSNTAFIVGATSNLPDKQQTINAGSITMRSGAGGVQNGAVILGPKQEITTSGDVLLAGGGTGGTLGGVRMGGLSAAASGLNTPTDLTLRVGNDLLMRGGVTPQNSANIGSTTGQSQTIVINAARDVIVNDTATSVSRIGTVQSTLPTNGTPGSISVTAGRDIKVNGGGEIVTTGTVALKALNGTVSVDASSLSAAGARVQSGAGQDVQAQSVSVNAANNRSAQLINQGIGTQSVTAGSVEIKTSGLAGGLAEMRNNSAADQIVTVTGEKLTVNGLGGGTATITAGANQTIDMTRVGAKTITLGGNIAQGISTIASNGDQKILGYADINITGGSGPNGANSIITASNPNRTQRVEANNLTMANSDAGGGGSGSVAAILGAKQTIHALGNVTLTANASGGTLPGVRIGGLGGAGTSATGTDLTLTAGGNVELKGSNTTANNGVGIGTSGAVGTLPLANKITIDAGGNVILTAGSQANSGVRIGTSTNTTTGTGPGDISIKAGGSIELNGTAQPAAIRTTGNVNLEAASINEGTNGLILADTLTTTTTGTTNLAGPNDVARLNATSGGPFTFVDAGGLQVTGISTTNDAITLTTDSLTNSGLITNGGPASTANMIFNADAFNLAGGQIQGGNGAVALRPRTGANSFGIESAGATTLSNADIASIQTENFIIFGSSTGNIFTGNMTIGENARVEGNGKNLAFSRTLTLGAEMITIGSQGVATSGDVIIGAGGGGIRSNGGTVTGDEVVLRASNGIGTSGARVKTAANALALNNAGGNGVFVSELDNVTLRTISLNAGGPLTVSNTNSGSVSLISGGDVNVAGLVSSGGSMIVDAAGALKLDGSLVDAVLSSNGGQAVTARSIDLTAQNGRRANIENTNGNQSVIATAGDMNLQVPGGFGVAQIVNTATGGNQTVRASGQLNVLGGVVTPTTSRNSGIFKNGPGGLQTVSAAGITLQGASTGNTAGAIISSQSDQFVDVSGGTINLRGGDGGTGNNATIGAAATGRQTILARDINLSNGIGGTDTAATIVGGHQLIDVTGNVTLTAQGSLMSSSTVPPPGARIGAPGGSTTGTDLTLLVDGNLTLNGGSVANNGASIGASSVGTAQQNTIVIDVGGSVRLESGSAPDSTVRIGSSFQNGLAGGNISVKAGGSIELNGTGSATAIRTLGNVTLEAASISEAANGSIQASGLTTKSTAGDTSLTGPNQVSSYNGTSSANLSLTNSGPLTVTGVDAAGNASLSNALGDVTLTGRWRSATASISSGGSLIESGAGFIQTGSLTTFSGGATSLTGANQVASINASTSFGGTGGVTLNNAGALTVTSLATGGNATLTNNGAVTVSGSWTSSGATNIVTTGGDLTVTTNTLRSTGAMEFDVGGRLVLSANGSQSAVVTGMAGQTVRAQGVEITSQNGGFASFEAQGGDQHITVNGGSVDVQVLSGPGAAQIVGAAGGTQTVEVINGDHIAVNGRGNSSFAAIITGPTGTQAVSITGSGANALRLGSTGGGGFSEIVAGSQQVTAGAEGQNGSITIVGSSVNGRFAGISTQPTTGGTQGVSTSGVLRVTGGNASAQNLNAGLFHGGSGEQTVNAARIELVGGTSGSGNGALIVSNGANVPANAGAQTVNVTGDLIIAGGAGGSAGITGPATRLQQVRAHNIEITNSALGGNNSVGSITGGHQDIRATGNVTLTARGSGGGVGGPGVRIGGLGPNTQINFAGTSTDLDLVVGGNLVLNGGTAVNNGVGIGSSSSGAGLPNDIYIQAGGNVVLNSGTLEGTGARIGSSQTTATTSGNIEIHSGGAIELNGVAQPTAIRTLGNVTLDAASISESSNGFIVADQLTTTTTGATNLGGPNDIKRFEATSGGPLTLVDGGSLQVLGIATTNDTITLTTDSLTNSGVITNGGPVSTANIVLNANSFNLAGGTIEGGAAAVIVRPRAGTNSFGIEADAQTTLTNADIASIHTSDFVVFGSGMGTTFTGDMFIGRHATVDGGGKNLAFFRSSQPGGSTTIGIGGVSTTGNVIVSAGGGKIVSEGGTVAGDQVQLRASHGIGDQFMRVQTAANRLAIDNFGPESAYVFETGDVTLGNVNLTVGGIANNVTNTVGGGGAYDVLAGGSITVSDVISAGSVALGASNGSITEVGAGAIIANDLRTFSGQSTLLGGANQVGVFSASAGGDLLLNNAGTLNVTSLFGNNVTVTNSGDMTVNGFWNSAGATSITTTGAGSDLTVSNSTVFSQGAMTLSVDGVLTLAASGMQVIPPPPGLPPLPPVPNLAFLTSSGGQNITARSILLSATGGGSAQIVSSGGNQALIATSGGLDLQSTGAGSSAQLTNNGANQTISATGGMRLLAQAGGGGQVSNFGSGDQSIVVTGGGLSVTGDGGFVSIANVANPASTPGTQTIRVLGGSGIDMKASNNGGTSISQSSPGREQKILVTDADHIKLDNTGGSAVISSNGGTQTVSITGGGANAIVIGTAGGRSFAGISNGHTQNITAGNEGEQGSITITGSAINGTPASIASRTSTDGTQTVSTSGLLRVVGGTAPSQTSSAGIFHNGSGEQKVSAARIELEGGASGNNNSALIVAGGGGVPANGGAQTINVTGDLIISGAAGGNAGLSGSATRLQTIGAHNIEMTNSALGGNNSVGSILGGHQDIHATGNVTMTARASGGDLPGIRIGGLSANNAIGFPGTGTDLKLVVDGNLTLNGSTTTANNGVGIGTSAAVGTPAFDNKITIEAGGNVTLNAGTFESSGVRIGTSTNTGTGTGGGDIRITAGGNISLNGTAQAAAAIRTRGDVTLDGATISEAGRGLIEANALTTRSIGDTQLGGPNSVNAFVAESDHGNVHLNNTSALLTLGSMDLPGNLSVAQAGDVTIGSASTTEATLVAAAGDVSMSASGQILVRGSDTTIGASSAVLAGGELSFSAGDVTLRAGDAALTPVVVRGANGVQMTVGNELNVTAGGMLMSPSLLTSGRNIDLTIGGALRIDGNGPFSLARVQTESRDGVISISFPNLTSGGYFVDGVEGSVHHGQTGFFTDFKAAKVGRTLLLDYGN